MSEPEDVLTPLRWDGALHLIDQRFLPAEEVWLRYIDEHGVAQAIRDMVVRGAPAIGCAAAYGVALAARRRAAASPTATAADLAADLAPALALLAATRPTAVNLFWAIAQMRQEIAAFLQAAAPTTDTAISAASATSSAASATSSAANATSSAANATSSAADDASKADAAALADALEARAVAIHADDVAMCRRIGRHGAELLPAEVAVLTHCNAGALATGGYGTALGVIRAAREAGKTVRVLADETRPYLQGARLTAWELVRDGFDVTIIPDGAAAYLMSRREIDCVVVGADRIAANGDVANKIGTYALALAAARHGLPFYVAAPLSTLDLATPTGADIPIEERAGAEVLNLAGTRIAAAGARARYPAFDVTPADLVTAIITDRGVARAPYTESLAALASASD